MVRQALVHPCRFESPVALLLAVATNGLGRFPQSLNAANPYPMPTPSRWHPLPATAGAYADSSGEDWEVVPEVMKASKVVEAMKASKVVSWKERAMVEGMYASPSAGHAKVVCAAEATAATKAVHDAAEAMASKTTHRVGGQWRAKHRHHNSTSDCYFAEHDNPPDCHKLPRAIMRTRFEMFK
jgi:hypothetical protein